MKEFRSILRWYSWVIYSWWWTFSHSPATTSSQPVPSCSVFPARCRWTFWLRCWVNLGTFWFVLCTHCCWGWGFSCVFRLKWVFYDSSDFSLDSWKVDFLLNIFRRWWLEMFYNWITFVLFWGIHRWGFLVRLELFPHGGWEGLHQEHFSFFHGIWVRSAAYWVDWDQ